MLSILPLDPSSNARTTIWGRRRTTNPLPALLEQSTKDSYGSFPLLIARWTLLREMIAAKIIFNKQHLSRGRSANKLLLGHDICRMRPGSIFGSSLPVLLRK